MQVAKFFTSVFVVILSTVKLLAQGAPPPPTILSVSVDPTTKAVTIRWNANVDPATPLSSHGILERINSLNMLVGTAPFPASTYTTSQGFVDETVRPLSVFAKSPAVTSPSERTDYHSFMVTEKIPEDNCMMRAGIRWTPYRVQNEDMVETPTHAAFNSQIRYEVWGYDGDPPFNEALATCISGTQRLTDTVYYTSLLKAKVNYSFFVKAFLPNGEESKSHYHIYYFDTESLPSYVKAQQLDATDSRISFNFTISPDSEMQEYFIARSSKPDQDFSEVHKFTSKALSNYVDNAITAGQNYYYYVGVMKCGKPIMYSDTIGTVMLSTAKSGSACELKWTPYFKAGATYEVLRVAPDNTVVASGLTSETYTDNLQSLMQQGYDKFSYRIRVTSGAQTILSPVQTITLTPEVHMPDAIDPTSSIINPTTGRKRSDFGPIIDMPDASYGYQLVVFNRWNVKVFETTKKMGDQLLPKNLWDGTYKGKKVEPGVYLYTLTTNFSNNTVNSKGTVTVVY